MRNLYQFAGLIFCMAITVPAARSQQQPDQAQQPQQPQQPEQPQQPQGQEQPIPAYKSPLASQADNDAAGNGSSQLAPDNRPLTGIQDFSLGVPLDRHSYWQPHAEIDFTGDSEPPDGGGAGWTAWTSIVGGVDVLRYAGNTELSFDYLGGGVFSNNGSVSNGVIQDVNLAAQFNFRRWTLTLIDELRYTPEIAFGNAGFGGLSGTVGISGGLGGVLGTDDTILNAFGQRLINSSAAQVNVLLSPRSSLTFSGGYSELYFVDQDLLNSTEIRAQAGYNYQLTKKDTVGVAYLFDGFRYSNFPQSIDTHSALLSYGRRITGRLAFQASAGPEYAIFQNGLASGTPGGTTSPSSSSQLYWSLYTALRYQLQRTGLYASYSHGVTGGSGVLAGAIGDTVQGSVSRQISRTLNGDINLGYARNKGLPVPFPGFTTVNGTYDYWSAGGHLTHPWGRTLQLFVGYQFQYQNSNAPFCSGTGCGGSYTRNLITVGLGWRAQPKVF
jgi:hypothetical protein